MTREPEQIRAFRDTWAYGIHSYLAYLRDRLVVARELLTETGSVFVQIGEENIHLVRSILDEIFGSENFISSIYFSTTGGFSTTALSRIGDNILWYAKSKDQLKVRKLFQEKDNLELGDTAYKHIELKDGKRRPMTLPERRGEISIPEGSKIYRQDNMCGQGVANKPTPFEFEGKTYHPANNSHWKASYPAGMDKLKAANRIEAGTGSLSYVRFLSDNTVSPYTNVWSDTGHAGFASDKLYVVETNVKVVERCILMTTDPGDLILDPTCGSGTTAYVAEQWGRRWITCDTSRVALSLARQRLMTAKFPYYILSDSEAGSRKEAEIIGRATNTMDSRYTNDIRKGFVYKRVPHVTLGSIANNPDIKEGMSHREIDATIARHADLELLYDQPYEDNKRLRVCGPFTSESLSPHRMLTTGDERPASETEAKRDASNASFETLVIDNLKKAGVQNTRKGEKLKFDDLHPHVGRWIQASGTYTDADGKSKRVAISIGPEFGAVSPEQVASVLLIISKMLSRLAQGVPLKFFPPMARINKSLEQKS